MEKYILSLSQSRGNFFPSLGFPPSSNDPSEFRRGRGVTLRNLEQQAAFATGGSPNQITPHPGGGACEFKSRCSALCA